MGELVKSMMSFNDIAMLRLAREIAMDVHPIEEILTTHGIDQPYWEALNSSPIFQSVLKSAVEEWQSATNTSERVKLKSMVFVEEALPEFYARAHDPKEPLAAKTEVLTTIARLAGMGVNGVDNATAGERMTVTINLGADKQLKIEKDITPRSSEIEYG
jgi:hypothetical protein